MVRGLVSKKKVRFKNGEFDLDLTYITDRIIAMGFPSEGLEAAYRNRMAHVQAFFERYHPGHFKVYNLCSERSYDPKVFNGNVERFGFDDHNTCPLWMIEKFCLDVSDFLKSHPQNVVAVHCKAGKGRTGLMISSYLLHSKQFAQAADALKYFGEQRTKNGKGVTIPSQKRFVHYYQECLQLATVPRTELATATKKPKRSLSGALNIPSPVFLLKKVTMNIAPNFDSRGGCYPYFRIYQYTSQHRFDCVFNSLSADGELPQKSKMSRLSSKKTTQSTSSATAAEMSLVRAETGQPVELDMSQVQATVEGDTKIEFYHLDFFKDEKMCGFWFHTAFLPAEQDGEVVFRLPKEELDKACKFKDNSKTSVFPGGFTIALHLTPTTKDELQEEDTDVDTTDNVLQIKRESVYHSARTSVTFKQDETKGEDGAAGRRSYDENVIVSPKSYGDGHRQRMSVSESVFKRKTHTAAWWLSRIFEAYDTSGEGSIEETEFRLLLEKFGILPGGTASVDKDLEKLQEQMEEDGDGTIAWPEFFEFVMRRLSLPNGDGALSHDQAKYLMQLYRTCMTENSSIPEPGVSAGVGSLHSMESAGTEAGMVDELCSVYYESQMTAV